VCVWLIKKIEFGKLKKCSKKMEEEQNFDIGYRTPCILYLWNEIRSSLAGLLHLIKTGRICRFDKQKKILDKDRVGIKRLLCVGD
jgi:hypothetical protein